MIAALFVQKNGLRERFFAKTRRDTQTGCLLWTGSKNKKGYGQFSVASCIPKLAHRVAWALAPGSMPTGCLMHICDVPGCVEVGHLKEGTRAENNQDMRAKGRAAHPPPKRGEESPFAKLSWKEVAEIRSSNESGPILAARYSVCRSTISQVRRKVIWR